MNPILVGLIAGVLFGCVDVALMLPMDFPDKKAALIAAFCSRFAIGFLIPLIRPSRPEAAILVILENTSGTGWLLLTIAHARNDVPLR